MFQNVIKKCFILSIIILFGISSISSVIVIDDSITKKDEVFSFINNLDSKKYYSLDKELVLNDTIPPVIIDNSQTVGYTGDIFGFDAIIYDEDENVSTAWVEYWYEDGEHINLSMIKISCEIFHQDIILEHTTDYLYYFISANDTSNNWNRTKTTQLPIFDNDLPNISNITAEPEFVYHQGFVNISVKVDDNILLYDVNLYIKYPNSTIENISIFQNWTGLKYFCKKYYDKPGIYTYNISAIDSSNNQNQSENNTFIVVGNPDLYCKGKLSWVDIEPASIVSDNVFIENIGDPYSLLNWEILSYPNWGEWTFIPANGFDLKPEDGSFSIEIEIISPNEQETEFVGEIILANSDNLNDTCIIEVSLTTPNYDMITFSKSSIIPKYLQQIIRK